MKSKNTKIIIFSVALAALLLGVLAIRNSSSPPLPTSTDGMEEDVQIENDTPNLTLKDYNGNDVNLQDIEGELVLLNSWAAWCPFCVNELPDFAAAQEEFGDRITIVAINREESLNRAKTYTDDLGVTDRLLFLVDPDDEFYRSIGGFAMPETLFIKNGEVLQHKRGPLTLDQIRVIIQSFLEEQV